MKQTIDIHEFRRQFKAIRPDNFSCEGIEALFNYLKEYKESTGEEVELDVIALCCEYTEYDSLGDMIADYRDNDELAELADDNDVDTPEVIEWFSDRTQVIVVEQGDKPTSYIIGEF